MCALDTSKPLRILDPIHGLIQFDAQPFHQLLERLINTRPMQRLREIKQLGLAEYVYPGATHTRFSHSLGVAFVAQKILSRLSDKEDQNVFDAYTQKVLLVSALLHDIGHGPLSHTFEAVEQSEGNHLDYGRLVLEHPEIRTIIHDLEIEDTQEITNLWSGQSDIKSSIISGALDADRLDYLRRDQIMTGSHQGQFDWPWMLDNLIWGEKGLMLGHRSVAAAEAFLLVRGHLYQTVYFHRTVRGAERLLLDLLRQYRTFCLAGESASFSQETAFLHWFITPAHERTAEDFLPLNDITLHRLLLDLSDCRHETLRNTARRLRRREYWHCYECDHDQRSQFWSMFHNKKICEAFEQDTGVVVDQMEFSAYNPDAPIWIYSAGGIARELSDLSTVAGALSKPTQLLRFYYDNEDKLACALEWLHSRS